ncbi:MAG: DUF4007 family protein [Lamprocystis purpurea]|jgi:hypothetical protein|uniref:DUF4007 family protein n=1 Tax=Lamprocystis purpurea TaxID=61598 RepID=UPI0003A97749|nr:DUF4007 family protein [Lamprocystis purpurea]MBV5275042.1 DUF4007 family protein [Lamprocystis purpurea]
MAMINTQTFALTKQRLITALALIPKQPDAFTASRMRETRVQFISGKNVLDSIKGWLLAANVVVSERTQYFLTDYGKRLLLNDPRMENTGSWWSLHLAICFSERCDPYRSLFYILGESSDYVTVDDALFLKLAAIFAEQAELVKPSTIESNLDGVLRMFMGDSPLSDPGLIDIIKTGSKKRLRLAEPNVPEQALVHALALARHKHFPTRSTVHFRELVDLRLQHFLCLSMTDLKERLRDLGRSAAWQHHFEFLEGQGLDSVRFGERLNPNHTLLNLLQESKDTWI